MTERSFADPIEETRVESTTPRYDGVRTGEKSLAVIATVMGAIAILLSVVALVLVTT